MLEEPVPFLQGLWALTRIQRSQCRKLLLSFKWCTAESLLAVWFELPNSLKLPKACEYHEHDVLNSMWPLMQAKVPKHAAFPVTVALGYWLLLVSQQITSLLCLTSDSPCNSVLCISLYLSRATVPSTFSLGASLIELCGLCFLMHRGVVGRTSRL